MWEVYDEYCRDFERQRVEEAAKQKAAGKKQPAGAGAGSSHSSSTAGGGAVASTSGSGGGSGGGDLERWARGAGVLDGLRILDRMVNQNTYADINMDFKYWDDSGDAFK